MRNAASVVVFALAVLFAVVAPGRSAEATDCWPPGPTHLFLELESVTVDGVPVEPADESWAHLEPWDYERLGNVDSLDVRVEKPWTDRWDVGGRSYERVEK